MILVTGATGNVGRELVPLLASAGQRARALVRDKRKMGPVADRIECVEGDLDRPETLGSPMRGIESVYIVSPLTQQVSNMLAAARAAGVRRIVKQSTIEADRSLGPGKWHREQELLIEASGMEWTFLRPTLMMVNLIQWWGETVRRQARVYFPGGKGKAVPVDPRDIASVAFAVLTCPGHTGQIYDLTGPEPLSAREMVDVLSRGETFGAWERNEYAFVSDAVERVTGRKPRSFGAWCRDYRSAFTK